MFQRHIVEKTIVAPEEIDAASPISTWILQLHLTLRNRPRGRNYYDF